MENLNGSDSQYQADITNRNYQNYSPTTSCSLSTSGSTYSLSSSPNSINSYVNQISQNESIPSISPQSARRRQSEPLIRSQYSNFQSDSGYLNHSIMSQENGSPQNNMELNCARPVNRFFPDGVVDILNKWFYENQNYPYPDENMTNILAKEANISAKQVRKWFANKRVRSNKCYKQTFRIRKDLQQPKNIHNRRLTKSVSDSDSMYGSSAQSFYYDNEFEEEHIQSPEINDRKFLWHNEQMMHMSSPGSSGSLSPPSYGYSPQAHQAIKTESPTYQNQHAMINSYSMNNFDQIQAGSNSSAGQANSNGLTALYNPLFLMNILQNPSIALQAVLANRLISLNNNNSENSTELSNSMQSTPIQKRKTHLSNRFHNESYNSLKSTNLDLIHEVEANTNSVKSEPTYQSAAFQASHQLRELLINKINTNDSTCSNGSSRPVPSSFSLDDLSTSINSTSNVQFINQVSSHSPPKPFKKINFGDISSLI